MTWPSKPCGSCGTPIVFAQNTTTGKRMPVDLEPAPSGNCRLIADGDGVLVEVLGVAAARMAHEQDPALELRLNHFVTCPQSAQWRSKPKVVAP